MIRSVTGAFAFGTVLPLRTGSEIGRGVLTALPLVGVGLGNFTDPGHPDAVAEPQSELRF